MGEEDEVSFVLIPCSFTSVPNGLPVELLKLYFRKADAPARARLFPMYFPVPCTQGYSSAESQNL